MPTECPVCGRAGLQSSALECPQCNADLEAFQLLEALQEPPAGQTEAIADESPTAEGAGDSSAVVPSGSLGWIRLAVPTILASMILGAGAGYLVSRPPAGIPIASRGLIEFAQRPLTRDDTTGQHLDRLEDLEHRLARMAERLSVLAGRDELVELDERLSFLEEGLRQWAEQVTPLPPTAIQGSAAPASPNDALAVDAAAPSGDGVMHTHRLTREDTLWGIAEHYFGAGNLYPIVLALNPGLGVRFAPGGTIRLPTDRAAAQHQLEELLVKQGGQRLLRYPTVAGDTWQRISLRLHGHTEATAELRRLNGGGSKPGASVLIPLAD